MKIETNTKEKQITRRKAKERETNLEAPSNLQMHSSHPFLIFHAENTAGSFFQVMQGCTGHKTLVLSPQTPMNKGKKNLNCKKNSKIN